MTAKEVRRLDNDALIRHSREERKKAIHACSQRAAGKIVSSLPKSMARRIDLAVLTEIVESEFQSLK